MSDKPVLEYSLRPKRRGVRYLVVIAIGLAIMIVGWIVVKFSGTVQFDSFQRP